MKNKKLLKFLLKDLSELDELISENENTGFDELEMEFISTRIKGVKKMIQILYNQENESQNESVQNKNINTNDKLVEETTPLENPVKSEVKKEPVEKEFKEEDIITETSEVVEEIIDEPEKVIQKETPIVEADVSEKDEIESSTKLHDQENVELADDDDVDNSNRRISDSFSKEKSVNDLITADVSNLENKLSNRPVISIKASIGINDKFQYIRELFDGKADVFSNAVNELDTKKDIKEAVEYLQQNFKWKKNETSLKFVNLVKRRFSND